MKPLPPGLAWFTATYMLAAIALAVSRGNREFLFYIAVMLVLIGTLLFLHARIGLSAAVLWGMCLWGLAHMAGGLVPVPDSWPINGDIRVLYSWWIVPEFLKYDHLVHAFGFGVTTFLCWEGLQRAIAGSTGTADVQPTVGLLFLCASASTGLGAMNEIVEFAAVLLVPETNVGGYINTGWDLVSNLVGAALAAVLIYSRRKARGRDEERGRQGEGETRR